MNLYKWSCDYGRMGCVEGLFAATQEQVDNLSGKTVYFGEILGKHSEVKITFEKGDIKKVHDGVPDWIRGLLPIGYDPVNTYEPCCDECGCYLEEECDCCEEGCIEG